MRWLLALAVLPGCSLVDQRTFNPQAGVRPVVASAPAAPAAVAALPGPPPLLTIVVPPPATLRDDIGTAVAAARRRKPGVVFDVVEITPDGGAGVGGEAAGVARLIAAQGVPSERVHLAARAAPGGQREVRVYVR